ncbi:MAG: acetyltransferase [Clostridia bacterium]|nr:acetyltransferase [Clostridia bacterium]
MQGKKNKRLLILGAGGHGRVVADCAYETGYYREIAFLDDEMKGKSILGHDVVGGFNDFMEASSGFDELFVAIGKDTLRVEWMERIAGAGYRIAVLVHPGAWVSRHAIIDFGSVVLAGAVVNSNAKLGTGVIINTNAVVEHDCVIGKGVHVSPGAIIAGNAVIGEYTWVCMGAKVSNDIKIGRNSVIAAGAVVTGDVGDYVMVAGIPAGIKKELK